MEETIGKRFRQDIKGLVRGRPNLGRFTTDVWDEAGANEKLFYEQSVNKLEPWVATFYSRKTHFPRLVAQQGRFTFASKPDSDHWVQICAQTAETERWTLTIGSSAKPQILRGLNIAGINGATLFPGADGIGMSLEGFVRTRYLS
jgi:hypothetical protein